MNVYKLVVSFVFFFNITTPQTEFTRNQIALFNGQVFMSESGKTNEIKNHKLIEQ